MATTDIPALDYRALMDRVEQVVSSIEHAAELEATVRKLAAGIVDRLGPDLGFTGGRIYRREGSDYRVIETFGDARQVSVGARIPRSYPSVKLCLAKGSVYVAADDPSLDRALEDQLGAREFAAIELGEEQFLVAFNLARRHRRDDVLFSLGLLRSAIGQKLRHERIEEVFRQARRIQASILPRQMPSFGPFDIAGRSDALETVGGDFYDFIPLTDKILGLAIADVSGHGLPAALQVRDIYMGLRMGMARDFKIVRTVERLNQIIHHSTLTSRFVSMFYGELEIDGTFIYVNAGHPGPFHLTADGVVRRLEEGGVVLGPVPEATYMRGYLTLRPGDLLVLYTDGVVELPCRGEDHDYGFDRLVEVARAHRGAPAAMVVDAIFADVEKFCGSAQPTDDRTLVVVTYPSAAV